METIFLILAIVCLIIGVIGSVLPAIPGVGLVWASLLFLHYSGYAHFSLTFFIVTGVVMLFTIVLDYIVPSWGARKFGGTKWGIRGANIGIIAGLFMGPLGIITGPFLGALLGEILYNLNQKQHNNYQRALKSAFGSFIGFLTGTGIKLIVSLIFAWFFIRAFF